LAATLPLPIQQNSRRRHIQRFLNLTRLSIVINLREQQIVLRPVIKLFKNYQIVIVGDREFHSVELAEWVDRQGVKFVLRQKKDTSFRKKRQKLKTLSSLQIAPGQGQLLSEISLTQRKGFGRFNLAIYWKRKYRGKQEKEPWSLLTNLADLATAVKVYKKRFGIEAMFRDCKTGGYNLEGSQASPDKLVRLILLIAIAMTSAWIQGEKTNILGKHSYVCRSKEMERTRRRHSDFWVGLYGHNWIVAFHECHAWVQEFIDCVSNKRVFYQRGLRALTLIQQSL
jgi:hypothetical protein